MKSYVVVPLFLVCLFVIMSSAQANENLDAEQEWSKFKTQYNRQYVSSDEENQKKQVFLKNLKEIQEHNEKYAQGLVTYKKGVNQFADETPEEFKQKHTGFGVRN